MLTNQNLQKPTPAFIGASWAALLIGSTAYLVGLWNASMQLNEKGYYFTILMYGLFAAVAVQKNIRDVASFGEEEPPEPRSAEPV